MNSSRAGRLKEQIQADTGRPVTFENTNGSAGGWKVKVQINPNFSRIFSDEQEAVTWLNGWNCAMAEVGASLKPLVYFEIVI